MYASSPVLASRFPELLLGQHSTIRETGLQSNFLKTYPPARSSGEKHTTIYAGKYEIAREGRRPRRYAFISCDTDLLLELPDFSTVVLIPLGEDVFWAGPTDQKFCFHRNAAGAVVSMTVSDASSNGVGQNILAQKVF